jgi:AraC-like DNA-binding protein/quercetin dioxygenase-like cupin family protein
MRKSAINCRRLRNGKSLKCGSQKKPFYNVFFFLTHGSGSFILDGNWEDIVTNSLFFIPPEVEFSISCEGSVDCFHISFDPSIEVLMRSSYFTITTQKFRMEFIEKFVELAGACLVLDFEEALQRLSAILEKLSLLSMENCINFAMRHVAVVLRDFPKHFHLDEYQIAYFAKGSGYVFVENRWIEYSHGTFMFVPPRVIHEMKFPRSPDIDMYSLKFKIPHDAEVNLPQEAFVCRITGEKLLAMQALLKKIVNEFVMDIPVASNRLSRLIRLINGIARPSVFLNSEDCIINQVENIVSSNYSRELHITEIARQIGLSTEYLSRQFRKRTQKTLVSYINEYRLKQSMAMLQNTDNPIKQVAADCGFRDVNYFTTMFRLFFSVTPKDIRKYAKSTE